MPRLRCTTIALMTLAGVIGAVAPIRAQNEADSARLRVGSLALSPAIRVTNVGWDSNVFNDSKDGNPQSDLTTTASPLVEAWFRTPRVRVNGRSQLDMYYFRELTSLRAVDNDHFGRVELIVNRVMPWVSGNFAATRHRQNLEIDAIAKRRNDNLRAGADVRLTKKTSVGFYAGRSHVQFDSHSLFRGTDLAQSLNHTGSLEGLAFRYAATPLTTIAVNVEQGRDRFAFSSQRNSDSVRISPSVEFKPLALISGRAAVGFRRVSFREGDQPEFKSTVASVDLQYTVRSGTQVAIAAQRDLEYSYIDTQVDYVLAGVTASVTQRIGDQWDTRGSVGRYRLGYRRRQPQGLAGIPEWPDETVLTTGVSIGYNIGRTTRIGFNVDHQGRQSDVALGRTYDRLRIGSSLTYVF